MAVATLSETQRRISHDINNRMNTLMLSVSLLETKKVNDMDFLVKAMKSELADLEILINEIKSAGASI